MFNVDDSKGNRYLLAVDGCRSHPPGVVGPPPLLVVVRCVCKYRMGEAEDLVDGFVEEMCAALTRAGIARELWVWKAYRARPVAVRRVW